MAMERAVVHNMRGQRLLTCMRVGIREVAGPAASRCSPLVPAVRIFDALSRCVKCPFWPHCRARASIWHWLRRSTSPRGRDIDPEPRRRPPGRRFVLRWTFGPRIRYAALEPGPLRPLERDLLLLLRASTPISRHLPHPPPSPKPWPLSDLHFFSSDSPFGRLCLVCALSVCSLCRPHEAAQATAAAARTADRAAGGAETTAAACA